MADLPSNSFWEAGSTQERAWLRDVIEQHGSRAWALALQIVSQVHDAENVLQESLLKLLQKSRRQPVENPSAYLRAVVRTTGLDVLARRRAEKSARAARDCQTSQSADPLELLHSQELLAQLDRAIAQLPPRLAKVVVARDICRQSYSQIAQDMGISQNTARVYRWRAIQQLQQILVQV